MFGRRHVGITHPEINDVFTARACLSLEAVDLFENVRREPLDAIKVGLHGPSVQHRCRVTAEHRGNKVASSMALGLSLRSTLKEYFGSPVARFALRHGLIVDGLAIPNCLDQHMTGGNSFPDNLMC